jgi:hypothetical protein
MKEINYLDIIPIDIYTQIYKYIYDDCMKEVVFSHNDKRNREYKKRIMDEMNDDAIWIRYTLLDLFNPVSLKIIGDGDIEDGDGVDYVDEEMYYLTKITVNNFTRYHYNILIAELPANFKDAMCIRMTLSLYDLPPLYYLLDDFLSTWIELIYYTNRLVKEYLVIHNLEMDMIPLYQIDAVVENGYTVIVASFE